MSSVGITQVTVVGHLRPAFRSRASTDATLVESSLVENSFSTQHPTAFDSAAPRNAGEGTTSGSDRGPLQEVSSFTAPTNPEKGGSWVFGCSENKNVSTYFASVHSAGEKETAGEDGKGKKIFDVQDLNEYWRKLDQGREREWVCCACEVKNRGQDGWCFGCGDEVCEWCKRMKRVREDQAKIGEEQMGRGDGKGSFELVKLT